MFSLYQCEFLHNKVCDASSILIIHWLVLINLPWAAAWSKKWANWISRVRVSRAVARAEGGPLHWSAFCMQPINCSTHLSPDLQCCSRHRIKPVHCPVICSAGLRKSWKSLRFENVCVNVCPYKLLQTDPSCWAVGIIMSKIST